MWDPPLISESYFGKKNNDKFCDGKNFLNVFCFSLFFTERDSTETKLVWKTDNIITDRQPETEPSTGSDVEVVKCLSYHLTSFSVIMRPAELQVK